MLSWGFIDYKIYQTHYKFHFRLCIQKTHKQHRLYQHSLLSYFYADNENGDIVPIVVSVYYNVPTIVFGLYGDEASGIKFSKTIINDVGGDDYFYLIDNKFQKISNKDKDK